jgi:hypothetical protein
VDALFESDGWGGPDEEPRVAEVWEAIEAVMSRMSPAPDERDRILAAMDRILGGTPQRSNGALTIVALATEADVP